MRSPVVGVAASALLVGGLVVWGASDQVGADDPVSEAGEYVPPDGTRAVRRDADGRVTVTEDARLAGIPTLVATPPSVAVALVEGLDGAPEEWRFWRRTTTTYEVGEGETGEQATSLFRLTEDGVEQVATYGVDTLVFDPPLTALPADAADGSNWDGSGTASLDGSLTYDLQAAARSSDDDCLRVTGTVGLQRDGADLADLPFDETWCRGEPLRLDGEEPAEAPSYDGEVSPQVGLASGAEDWVAHLRPLTIAASLAESTESDPPVGAQVDLVPAGTGAGGLTLTTTATDDVFGLLEQGGRLVRAWVGHPGGDVTAVATSGDVSVVGTSRRELVAYGERGQWLWRTDLGGVPVTTPLAADDDRLVAGTVAGGVVALDPATGEVAWRATMTDAVRRTPVTDGESVVAVDTAGHVAAWDLASGEELWSTDIAFGDALGVSGSVLAVRGENAVLGFDLRTGTRLWSRRVGTDATRALVGTGRTFTVASRERTLGLDRATGEIVWERPGAEHTTGLDARSVQVDEDDELVVRDGDGDLLTRLDLEGLVGTQRWLTPADAGVWVADAFGHVVEVSP